MKSLAQWDSRSSQDARDALACSTAIRSVAPNARVVLFGSRARGDTGPESDFDLLVTIQAPVADKMRRRLSDALYSVELERGIVVSCLVCSLEEWNASPWRAAPFRANVERDGVAL